MLILPMNRNNRLEWREVDSQSFNVCLERQKPSGLRHSFIVPPLDE
jgi:hypothetical protein